MLHFCSSIVCLITWNPDLGLLLYNNRQNAYPNKYPSCDVQNAKAWNNKACCCCCCCQIHLRTNQCYLGPLLVTHFLYENPPLNNCNDYLRLLSLFVKDWLALPYLLQLLIFLHISCFVRALTTFSMLKNKP